jgi:hypothetical protein
VVRRLVPLAAAAAAAALAWALSWQPYLGYDAIWALTWGQQTWHGHAPAIDAPSAPTAHPLLNAFATLLAPFGHGAQLLLLAAAYLALGGVAWCWLRLGGALFGRWVGAVSALILLTRPQLLVETSQAVVDVFFLWLVSWAALCAAEERRERVLPLLALAGLLRPEAWLLGAVYAVAVRPRNAALAVAAPSLWALLDLAVTGDPLFSLHHTQGLAAELGRTRGHVAALRTAADGLRTSAGATLVWIGLAGALAGLLGRFEASRIPAALGGLGVLAYVILGLTGLPLLPRYLLVATLALALFAALALAGWTAPVEPRRAWAALGVVAIAALLVRLPAERDALAAARAFSRERARVQQDLEAIAGDRAVRAALRRCGGLSVPDDRPHALLAWWLDRSPGSVAIGGPGPIVFSYAAPRAAAAYALGRPAAPPQGRALAANRSWRVSASGRSAGGSACP